MGKPVHLAPGPYVYVRFLGQLWQEHRRSSPHFTIVNLLLPKLIQKVHIQGQGVLGTIPSPRSSPSHPSALPLPLPPHNHSNNLLRLRGASTSAGCAASCKASPRIAPFGMTWSQCSGTTVSTSEPCQSFDLQGLAEETWCDCPAVPSLPSVTFKVVLLATQKTIYLPTQ